MSSRPLKLAIIAGEPSGDLLGADLIASLHEHYGAVELIGVGGEAMAAQGLKSLFDYHDLSIVGVGQIVAQLPKLLSHLRKASRAVIAARPDVLVIIDSPEFTHRVARRARATLPDLPIINYVCPTVWAWKPERAPRMRAYVDHVLSIFPFEAEVVERLGGPPLTYVGHRLATDASLLAAASHQRSRRALTVSPEEPVSQEPLCLIMPGSRSGELKRLLPDFSETAHVLAERMPGVRFQIPTLPRLEDKVRAGVAEWTVPVRVTTSAEEKVEAFAQADVALAASGTVLLELALVGVPCVSAYRVDPLSMLIAHRITAWTAALPNFIADYPLINEYMAQMIRPPLIARRLERLLHESAERHEMLQGFDIVREKMTVDKPPADIAAAVVAELISPATTGSS
ncbi:lipid-A-disaccharide synthase [Hoeflea prorocentri]|uniref:Lipid-A-disaccharide synthase n=1 Tax=Hoeflea prorocentri TaxID=1922333 RepID=A0A9X3UHU3_9HYPH|nr:lipid-A-disaccharide synthase [Hoeflea prorocentri]MCY6380934.1 lipid-A-disaccharide synthase [Hoeflea prorocentri]MDA5398734.1 lipid-A-disaccharide synthase [Hoeflea prorocentri]